MHVDGFRFDLAPALARELHEVDRLVRVLRPHPPGPGVPRVQADRRAVGPRRGRLPGRQLPAAVDRVERQVPRRRARLLARRASRRWPSSRSRLTGSSRPLPVDRPPAVREHQLRHRARRLHAARPRRRTTSKHNEANGEDNRDGDERQPLVELRRRGADRRPRGQRAARAPAAQLARHAAALAGRADAARRRRARPHAARQQQRATARTTRSRGSTGPNVDARRCSRSRARSSRCAATTPCFRRRRFFQGRPIWRRRRRHRAGCAPDGERDDRAGLAQRLRQVARVLPQRRGDRPPSSSRGERLADDDFTLLLQRAPRAASSSTLACTRRGAVVEIDTALSRGRDGHDAESRRTSKRMATEEHGRAAAWPRAVTPTQVPCRCTGAQMTPLVATYRLQLHAGFGFARARGTIAVPRRARRQPPLPLAGAAGRAGRDARLRRRRPHAGQRRARRRATGSRRCAPPLGAAGLGLGARHRAQPHGASPTPAQPLVVGRARERTAEPLRRTTSTSTGTRRSRAGNVLLPVLGDHCGRVLERGELRSARGRALLLRYGEQRFPLRPRASRRCARTPPRAAPTSGWRLAALPAPRARRRAEDLLDAVLARARGAPRPSTRARSTQPRATLDALLDAELPPRLLAHGRAELDYRRFFDIDTLVGLRVEDARVFADTHALVLSWFARAMLDGVRDRPSRRAARSRGVPRAGCAPLRRDALDRASRRSSARRVAAADWPVDGTTGYDSSPRRRAVRRPGGRGAR